MAMKPMKALISLEEGMRILMECVQPITRTERVGLLEACGRVLAERIVATAAVPPFARAAMDGYAVIAQDTFGAGNFNPAQLRLLEVVHAGDIASATVASGACTQVATGAPVPAGADAVVQVEDTELTGDGDSVKIYQPVYPRQNISPQGRDIQAGQEVLAAGTRLEPSKVGVLAALGLTQVTVVAKPTVAVVPSGNEIVAPGEPLVPGKIYDINSYTLASLIQAVGGLPRLFPIMKDTPEDVRRTLREALACDLVVLSGGSSVGERDVMVEAVASLGEVKFHGIAVKPGKPTLCGVIWGRSSWGCQGTQPRASPTATASWRRRCAGWRIFRSRGPGASSSPWQDATPRRPAAISTFRSESRAVRWRPPSKNRGRSRPWPMPRGISRYRPMSIWWKKGSGSWSSSSEQSRTRGGSPCDADGRCGRFSPRWR
jgi:molybdenum cofactor synthesis domain-containing protein